MLSIRKTISSVSSFLLNALFPLNVSERAIRDLTREQAISTIRPAPSCPIPHTDSVFAYKDDLASTLIWNIKYKRCTHSVQIGAYALYQRILKMRDSYPHLDLILIPMPITTKRRRERGYNQCELLLDEIECIYHSESNNSKPNNSESKDFNLTFARDLLIRAHHDSRQTLKNRKERLESAKGIFKICNTSIIQPEFSANSMLIVLDDVITTGSTIRDSMNTLRNAGFDNVCGLSIAH